MKSGNNKISRLVKEVRKICKSKRGEFFVGVGVKILIAVVIGALLLGGTYTLIRTGVLENTSNKVRDLFDYGNDATMATQDNVHPEIVSFGIEGVGDFQVEDGMTWGEWIQSYQISAGDNGIVWVDPQTLELCVDIGNGLWRNYIRDQHYGDPIVKGMTYTITGPQ